MLQEHAMYQTHFTKTIGGIVSFVELTNRRIKKLKSTFYWSSDEQTKRPVVKSTCAFNGEGKAMWPFYTVCLGMRVLGVSRAT